VEEEKEEDVVLDSINRSYEDGLSSFRNYTRGVPRYKLVPFFENNPTLHVNRDQSEAGSRGAVNTSFRPDSPVGKIVSYDKIRDLLAFSPFHSPLNDYTAFRILFVRLHRPLTSDFVIVNIRELGVHGYILLKDNAVALYTAVATEHATRYRPFPHSENANANAIEEMTVEVMDMHGNSVCTDAGPTDPFFIQRIRKIEGEGVVVLEMRNSFVDDEFMVGDVLLIKDIEWFHRVWWQEWNSDQDLKDSPFFLNPAWRKFKTFLERSRGHKIIAIATDPPSISIALPVSLNDPEVDCENYGLINGLAMNRSQQIQVGIRFLMKP